jgi:hypothetical protein
MVTNERQAGMKHSLYGTVFAGIAAACLIAAFPSKLYAQAEHVPATHSVYEYLDRLHVRGLIQGYSRADLPMELRRVRDYLTQARAAVGELSVAEASLLARYEDELLAGMHDDRPLRSIALADTDELLPSLFPDSSTWFLAWRSDDGASTMFMEILASLERRSLFGGGERSAVTLGQIGGRVRGTLSGFVGYTLTATNGIAAGDRSLALSDPQLRNNFNFGLLEKEYFDLTEAVLSLSWAWGAASFGKETRYSGIGRSNRALLSDNAAPFDAIRLDARLGLLRFSFLHGSLLSEFSRQPDGKPWYDAKYLAIHRAEADLFDFIRLGVFEAVIYSGRAPDLSYLNPINFYKSAEHAGGDRDNPMLGFEVTTLAFPGVQLYGTWLIDDVDFSRLGESWWGNKFILQGGLMTTALLPNTDVTVEYSRIDPYVYTHFFLGNQYTHNTASLGFELPPNSDEVYLGLTWWAGARLRFGASMQLRRHGMNEVDEEGTLLVNHGGDIYQTLRYGVDSDIAPFLAGIRNDSVLLTATMTYEPWRDIYLKGLYRYRSRTTQDQITSSDHYISVLLDLYL